MRAAAIWPQHRPRQDGIPELAGDTASARLVGDTALHHAGSNVDPHEDAEPNWIERPPYFACGGAPYGGGVTTTPPVLQSCVSGFQL